MDKFSQVFALLAGVVIIFGPLAVGLTKLVDMVRNMVDPTGVRFAGARWVWNVLALVLGLVVALVFEMNVMAQVLDLIPQFSDSTALDGVVGQVLTGVGMAGMASYHHETMDRKSAEAKVLQAQIVRTTQS